MEDYERNCTQCRFRLAAGRRCRNTTCDRFPFCWMHMKKAYGLVAQTSRIPNAGLGLFFVGYKDEDGDFVNLIKKNEVVTHYSGKHKLTTAQYDARFGDDTSYGVCTRRNECLDGGPTDNFPGRLINHKSYSRANVRWGQTITRTGDRYMLPMYATTNIRAGQELYIDYGPDYWRGRAKS